MESTIRLLYVLGRANWLENHRSVFLVNLTVMLYNPCIVGGVRDVHVTSVILAATLMNVT